jgi:cell wall-associated NlpC family hydrolase
MGLVRFAAVLAVALAANGCASSGAVPRPFPGGPASPTASSDTGSPDEAAASKEPAGTTVIGSVVETAMSLRGIRYRNGGTDPKGFDCSGLVQYSFAQHGMSLPRAVRDQAQLGREVRLAAIAPGDLIFFATGAPGVVSHVGVAIGGDEFVHAPSSRGVVRVEKFSDPYWARRIAIVRRVR